MEGFRSIRRSDPTGKPIVTYMKGGWTKTCPTETEIL